MDCENFLNMGENTTVALERVKKSYFSGRKEIRVLESIDLEVRKGEKIAIIGASGSGKTTLLSIIGTILKPDDGKVFIDGTDISTLTERELETMRGRKIAFIFQGGYLIDEMTVEENIMFFALRAGATEREVRRLIESLGIPTRNHVWELSSGEYQRVAIARAISVSPQIILADEPTGNLDPKTAQSVMSELLNLVKEDRVLILATHNMTIAKMLDKVYKIENGTLAEIRKEDL